MGLWAHQFRGQSSGWRAPQSWGESFGLWWQCFGPCCRACCKKRKQLRHPVLQVLSPGLYCWPDAHLASVDVPHCLSVFSLGESSVWHGPFSRCILFDCTRLKQASTLQLLLLQYLPNLRLHDLHCMTPTAACLASSPSFTCAAICQMKSIQGLSQAQNVHHSC